MIYLKRVYEPPSTDDGLRILVERLWPRGLSKSRAQLDLWLKDIAPSPQLRTWYGHELTKWEEFQRRYRAELQTNSAVGQLQQLQQADHHIRVRRTGHGTQQCLGAEGLSRGVSSLIMLSLHNRSVTRPTEHRRPAVAMVTLYGSAPADSNTTDKTCQNRQVLSVVFCTVLA
jgi:uncharacterized protein YeaO (DUF488 family)